MNDIAYVYKKKAFFRFAYLKLLLVYIFFSINAMDCLLKLLSNYKPN